MRKYKKFTNEDLEKEHLSVLRELGREIGVKAPAGLNKEVLIEEIINVRYGKVSPIEPSKRGAPPKIKIDLGKFYEENYSYDKIEPDNKNFELDDSSKTQDTFIVEGVFEPTNAYGFLRASNYENSAGDSYVSQQNIKKYNLKCGDKVTAKAKAVTEGSPAIQEIVAINDLSPKLFINRANFDSLTPCYPTKRLKLENDNCGMSVRLVDIFAPIGMGQRGLIVAPPKTGKTTLLKEIAKAIESNYKNVKLIMLLIGERPEEVTDIKSSISGEVVFSTFDERDSHHIRAAELVINRAKRLVEVGKDVVILMDSITRLARAYNNEVESSGKVLSGGLDPTALQGPKRFFGAARNTTDGGSLTILSTALIDTGSRMDDVIYEEFKGTGNMEIHLSRELAERRVFPAIDVKKSGTRKEELLLTEKEISASYKLRKTLNSDLTSVETLLETIKKTKCNQELIEKVDAWMNVYNK